MPKTHPLERAAYLTCRLRMEGYLDAAFTHERDANGRPTGRFIITPGEHTDVPARLLGAQQRKELT